MLIAVALPCHQFLAEQAYVFDPPGQALACHYIKLFFSNIQPASMFGNVMDFKLFAILRASGAENALYKEERAWALRLSMTSIILSRSG